ncbi:Predicted protein [Prochlorococcus marinus subsp. marinus str. CCMP1375]|uniref:Uncharacterized protein n=1 Tax=Prochlorococcus marinus (strain SARG / CCMP1375 / SS120) TaxID=167539 RepID=Q7VBC5_PROMA|nr:Predicted protein [Prochlorococcus marinus subsp. marinus str. CCMP1375]
MIISEIFCVLEPLSLMTTNWATISKVLVPVKRNNYFGTVVVMAQNNFRNKFIYLTLVYKYFYLFVNVSRVLASFGKLM